MIDSTFLTPRARGGEQFIQPSSRATSLVATLAQAGQSNRCGGSNALCPRAVRRKIAALMASAL